VLQVAPCATWGVARCAPHLWRVHQVHLQQAGLQGTLGGSVVLEGVEQEGRALLDQVVLHEHVHDLKTRREFKLRTGQKENGLTGDGTDPRHKTWTI